MQTYHCAKCGCSLGYEGLCWKCRAQQERSMILAWTDEEIAEKLAHLIAHADQLDDWDSPERKDARRLLEVRGICPPDLQIAAAAADVIDFENVYYHAPATARERLIQRLLKTDSAQEASQLICCLAMQGDDRALEVLFELEQNPRPWRQKLYVDPSVYAQYGGWTFDETGARRTLIFDTCYPLVKGDCKQDTAVRIGRAQKETCPQCGCTMMDMLVLDGRDERLAFLGINGIVTASCCPNCVCFEDASFFRYTLDGRSSPFPAELPLDETENYMGNEDLQALCENGYVLGKEPVSLFYGVYEEDVNTIGGFANWVQDWEYTVCPDCGKHMKYLAQIQWDTVLDYMEGTLYIEICPDCQILSMHHQQT